MWRLSKDVTVSWKLRTLFGVKRLKTLLSRDYKVR